MNEPQQLLDQLARSEIYRDYERSFSEATGMPLALRRVESWDLAHRGKRRENPFCAMLAASSPACAACLDAQKRIADPAACGPQSVVCFTGLSEASVPVRCGAQLLGFLQTGEVIVGRPSRAQFAKTVKAVKKQASATAKQAETAVAKAQHLERLEEKGSTLDLDYVNSLLYKLQQIKV